GYCRPPRRLTVTTNTQRCHARWSTILILSTTFANVRKFCQKSVFQKKSGLSLMSCLVVDNINIVDHLPQRHKFCQKSEFHKKSDLSLTPCLVVDNINRVDHLPQLTQYLSVK